VFSGFVGWRGALIVGVGRFSFNVKFTTGKSQNIRQVDITAESVAEAKEKVKAMYSSGGDIAKNSLLC